MANNSPLLSHNAERNVAVQVEVEARVAHTDATGLSVVYQPVDSEWVLDIVLIHGLQGHPFKTWAAEIRSRNDRKGKPKARQSSPATEDGRSLTKLKDLFSGRSTLKSVFRTSSEVEDASVFWPRDLLPLQCPRARILVYGYKTAVAKHQFAGAVNKNSIFAHSKDLVNDLSRTRPLSKPVLFVTHSLGGIVIKEALAICSTSSSPEFEDILASTAGVVFLGTPHRGSSAAGIGEIARKAASALLMDTNARILDSLALKNSDLERCQHTFSSLWLKYNFRVKTFQEGLPLKLPIRLGQSKMAKVVPDISSCLGDARERAETLDGDHRSMCRYASAQDPNYRKLAAELQAVYTTFLPDSQDVGATPITIPSASDAVSTSLDAQEWLEHFKFREMLIRQLTIGSPVNGTCQWLPDTELFRTWTERRNVDLHFGLLQIIGKPGSGKSTLMKKLLETTRSIARTRGGGCVVAHFFDRRGRLPEHCALGMLRSILYQLCAFCRGCLRVFEEYTPVDLELLKTTNMTSYLDILKASLTKILSDPSLAPRRTIIFIDALDECDQSEAAELGYFLAQLTRSAYDANVALDVCISRREYPSITVRNCLEIHMESHNVQDIRLYIEQKLEVAGLSSEYAETLQDTVAQRSNGIFLWVVLAVEGILKDLESGKNEKLILKRTKTLPKGLEDLFAQMLEGMDLDELGAALRLFQWAVLPTDRLRLREWHHILAFLRETPPASLKEWEKSDHYTETDTQLELQIRNLSQGLVEVKGFIDVMEAPGDAESLLAGAGSLDSTTGDSRVVQPIHETVTEFFVSGRASELFQLGSGYDFIGEGHLSIASACMDYVCISEFDELILARVHRHRPPFVSSGHAGSIDPRGRHAQTTSHRRSRSATSFMSSASAHSGQYRHQEDDAVDVSGSARRSRHAASFTSRPSTPIENYNQQEKNSGQQNIPTEELPPLATHTAPDSGDDCSVLSSAKSRTMEVYPALASYALNRAFVHARAGHALGADPTVFLKKLLSHPSLSSPAWYRWRVLQGDMADFETAQDFLASQELGSWTEAAIAVVMSDL